MLEAGATCTYVQKEQDVEEMQELKLLSSSWRQGEWVQEAGAKTLLVAAGGRN
jgi:hypothetical protein